MSTRTVTARSSVSYSEADRSAFVTKEAERQAREQAAFDAWMDANRVELADPATPTKRLGHLWNEGCRSILSKVDETPMDALLAANPSAPPLQLLWCASNWAHAPLRVVWFNPMVTLLMLEHPDRAWAAHAAMCLGGIAHADTPEEWRKTLLARCRWVLDIVPEGEPKETIALARQFVLLFNLQEEM